jgi:fumarate reductase flavoprotein subunit
MNATRRTLLKTSVCSGFLALASTAARATPVPAPAKWDATYDIVIIGAGGGGLMAAHYAAENGLKPVVLEKLAFPGGSSAMCGGQLSIADTPIQREKGIKDSDELFKKEMIKVGQGKNVPELVDAHIASIHEVFDFIHNTLGARPKSVNAVSGMSVPRAHLYYPPSNLLTQIFKYVKDQQNVPFMFNTPAERLVWEDGRIAGVRAKSKDKEVFIRATKGVILASGGFQYSKELMEKYNPLMAKVTPAGCKGNTGDGLKMAQAYGADVLDTNYIKATFGYQLGSYPDSVHCYYAGAIIVNHAGKRFVDESKSYKLLSDAALAQPDEYTFQLFDENIRRRRIKEHPRNAMVLDNKDLNEGKDAPFCYCGKTLEEVAKKAGVDPEQLIATVKQYNADVEKSGVDSLFGRKSLTSGYGKLLKIEEGPFFLYPTKPRCIATYCGVRIDPHARVIDVFGEAIPGLYACGEVTGGVHGAAYMTGTALGKAFSFGRIAALDIAGKLTK